MPSGASRSLRDGPAVGVEVRAGLREGTPPTLVEGASRGRGDARHGGYRAVAQAARRVLSLVPPAGGARRGRGGPSGAEREHGAGPRQRVQPLAIGLGGSCASTWRRSPSPGCSTDVLAGALNPLSRGRPETTSRPGRAVTSAPRSEATGVTSGRNSSEVTSTTARPVTSPWGILSGYGLGYTKSKKSARPSYVEQICLTCDLRALSPCMCQCLLHLADDVTGRLQVPSVWTPMVLLACLIER